MDHKPLHTEGEERNTKLGQIFVKSNWCMKEEEKRIKELDGNTMKECNEGM